MDIVAESLSAKILKSREVLVNGQDIMDYIRSKLSTAVEFSGVYDDIDNIPLSAQFNGSIVIVDSKEYIYSDKSEPNHWQEIGDETAVGQLATDLAVVSGEVSAIFDDVNYIKSISANYKTYADITTLLSSDGYALTTDIPTYSDISSNIHLSDYALTNNVSTAMELLQQFAGAKAYIDSVKSYADDISSKVDNLSNDLIYATVSTDTSLEGLTATSDRVIARRLVFKPSYLGMNSSDELKSIVLLTRNDASRYNITSAYIQVRKYNGLSIDGEIIGISKCFNWPAQNSKHIQIDFDLVILFNSPAEQYYFEVLSAGASSNLDLVDRFGLAVRVLNSADPKLPLISANYFITYLQANTDNELVFSNVRPWLSVSYRHAYSMAELSALVNEKYNLLVGQSADLSSADTIHGAKAYASDLINSLDVTDTPTTGKFVVAVSLENGVISVLKAELTIPEGLSSYVDTKNLLSIDGYLTSIPSSYKTYDGVKTQLSNDGYVISSQLSTASDISVAIKLQEQLDTKNKVEIAHDLSGAFIQTDLSIIKVTDGNLQTYAESLSTDTINPNAIYMLQLSAINAFGQLIHNVADGTISSDAATCGLLLKLYQMIVELSGKIS